MRVLHLSDDNIMAGSQLCIYLELGGLAEEKLSVWQKRIGKQKVQKQNMASIALFLHTL